MYHNLILHLSELQIRQTFSCPRPILILNLETLLFRFDKNDYDLNFNMRPTYHPVITSGIRKSNIGITHQTCLELIDVKSAFDVVHTHI
jgi:hypothetical protein